MGLDGGRSVFGGVRLAEFVAARPRGTEDVLPEQAARWRRLEGAARALAGRYGFGEVRTPVFEHSDLVHRIGASTDVVQKETYDFVDRGGRRLTLRPEGTAPVVRACLQGGLFGRGLPVKVYYVGLSAFRYERPEAGRLRQHHQFGCETFGADGPAADAELVALCGAFLAEAGVRGAVAHINSIGCRSCRPGYRVALQDYYRERLPTLCGDCQRRFQNNPLRLLDCKVDRAAAEAAPPASAHLCAACAEHHQGLRLLLAVAGVAFVDDPLLVRGFDYYSRTVFEFIHTGLGSQSGLGGGGRYDDLVADLGGPSLPAAGFGVGLERLLLALEAEGGASAGMAGPELFVCGEQVEAVFALCQQARATGLRAEFDPLGRSLKAQFRHADRLGARFVAILAGGVATLRDMRARSQTEVPVGEVVARVRAVAGL